MTTSLKRAGTVLLSVLLLCTLALSAVAASKLRVGVKFWKTGSDKESMANSGIDTSREASLTRQSNGTYTLTLPIQQVSKMGVTGYLTGLTIGDVTYNGTVTGDVTKDTGVLTIKNLPASVLTGSDVNKALTVTCNIHVLFHKVADHAVQLQHSVLCALHHLAGGTAQLPLVLGGRHCAHGPQCRPGRHAQQHTGRSLICLLFHCKHSFPCPLCGPLAVVFPVKNPLYAFFVQKVVVYCSMVFQAVLPFGGILPALDPYKVRRFLI